MAMRQATLGSGRSRLPHPATRTHPGKGFGDAVDGFKSLVLKLML